MNTIPKYLTVLAASTMITNAQNLLINGDFEDIGDGPGVYHGLNIWKGDLRTPTAGKWAEDATFNGGWLRDIESLDEIFTNNETQGISFASLAAGRNNITYQDVVTVAGQQYSISGFIGNAEGRGNINNPFGAIAAVFVDNAPIFTVLEGEWGSFNHNFTASNAGTTRISIGFTQTDPLSSFMIADDFKLISVPIPEPSSSILMMLGFSGLLLRRSR